MRYLPHTNEDVASMLQAVGIASLDDLFSTIPKNCCCRLGLNLPEAMTEWELNDHMDALANRMAVSPEYKVFMGAGSYDHYIPTSVTYLLSRSEFVTSYTPYQPEMTQGTLQAIYEYQTLASRLMGMEVTTASHYDGSTALAALRRWLCRGQWVYRLRPAVSAHRQCRFLPPIRYERPCELSKCQ